MIHLLLEERQHSWHCRPGSPGMDPWMEMDPWMGMEQEAMVQEDKCRAGWDPRCRTTHPPGSSFLCPWLTRPSQDCTVVSLHPDIACPFLWDLSFSSSGKLRIWGKAVSHRLSLLLTCCALFTGRLLCVSFQLFFYFGQTLRDQPPALLGFKHQFSYHRHPREVLFLRVVL